jgi:hypothetical protein
VRDGGGAHGKAGRTANTQGARQPHSHGNAVPAHGKASAHGKGLCRASSARRTAKTALPGGSLPSNLCRASPLGKGFAEHIWAFAVRFGCTATPCSAVVYVPSVHALRPPPVGNWELEQSVRDSKCISRFAHARGWRGLSWKLFVYRIIAR